MFEASNPSPLVEGDIGGEQWPNLPYAAWNATLETLHICTQIVGKGKLKLSPFLNEWWNVGFSVTARGMTTSTMPFHDRVFQIDFDFLDHRLNILVNDGRSRSLPLRPRSVADFYHEFIGALSELGIEVQITQSPVEVEQGKLFDQDRVHNSYNPDSVTRWWRILAQTDRLLQQFRASFVGKSSPVLFWWGSFQPDSAFFHLDLSEFILPYDAVRTSLSPDRLILDFFHSTYEAGATLGGWDRAALERPDLLTHRQGETS